MHPSFADWFRLATLEPSAEFLQNRRKVVLDLSRKPNSEKVIQLAQVAAGVTGSSKTPTSMVRKALQVVDPTVGADGPRLELAVLAGAALVKIMEGKTSTADMAAFSLISVDFAQSRGSGPLSMMAALASQWRRDRAMDNRKAIQWPPDIEIDPIDMSGESVPSLTPEIQGQLIEQVNALLDWHRDVGQEAQRAIGAISEETNIAWWLLGEYSRDLDQPLSDLSAAALPILLGKELAELTVLQPGPVALEAIVARMLRLHPDGFPKEIQLSAAVDALPREWRAAVAAPAPFRGAEAVVPVHAAIAASLQVPAGADWHPIFRQSTGLEAGSQMAPKVLGALTCTERLLIRAMADADESSSTEA